MINPNKELKAKGTHPIVLAAIANAHAKLEAGKAKAAAEAKQTAIPASMDIMEALFGKEI